MNDYITSISSSSNLKMSLDKLLEAVEQIEERIYEATEIFLGNPFDLIKMDMSKIPRNCYFISHYGIDEGKLHKVVDGKLKRELYEFIEKHPDRAFRGRKYN